MAAGDNAYWSDITYAINPPICRLTQTTAQTGIVNNTVTAMTFGTSSEVIDTHGMHDTASNTSRITPTVAGYYRFDGGVSMTGQTDFTVIEAFIRLNGSTGLPPAGRYASATVAASTLVINTGSVVYSMNGTTDYVELMLRALRSGAGASSTVISSQFTTTFQAVRVSSL